MANVHDFHSSIEEQQAAVDRMRRFDKGGGPPHDGDMEARISKLETIAEKTEKDLADIRVDLVKANGKMDEFFKHYATKADVMDAKNSVIMWVVSAILLAQLLPALLKKFGL
jgi:hypothetical protein